MITSLQPSAVVGAVLFVAIYGKLFKDFIFVHTLFNLHLIGVVYKLGTELSAVSTSAGVRANNECVGIQTGGN